MPSRETDPQKFSEHVFKRVSIQNRRHKSDQTKSNGPNVEEASPAGLESKSWCFKSGVKVPGVWINKLLLPTEILDFAALLK